METTDKSGLVHGLMQIAGPNRPGMVSETSKYILQHHGNIITSHATRLGSQLFTANILLSATPENYARIEAGLSAIKDHNPRLLRMPGPSNESRDAQLVYECSVYAFDKEGIVAEVAEILAGEGMDIIQLSCASYPAPFGGQPMFMIEMLTEAPNHIAAKKAGASLESLAPSRSWDVYWKPAVKTGLKINPLAAFPPSKMASAVE
jgi:glycine cleavage system regulatory protein